jgi:hypothetical protein
MVSLAAREPGLSKRKDGRNYPFRKLPESVACNAPRYGNTMLNHSSNGRGATSPLSRTLHLISALERRRICRTGDAELSSRVRIAKLVFASMMATLLIGGAPPTDVQVLAPE